MIIRVKKNNDDFDKLSDQLTNAFTNMDPNNPDATYEEIRRISRLLARSIQDDPESDQDMRKLGELLFKMSDTDDTDQLMEYLQQMTELMGNINK